MFSSLAIEKCVDTVQLIKTQICFKKNYVVNKSISNNYFPVQLQLQSSADAYDDAFNDVLSSLSECSDDQYSDYEDVAVVNEILSDHHRNKRFRMF